QTRQPPQKLNVLFIAVDDLNTALSAFGHPVVKSPNIDRLARRSVLFRRAYTQFPWCNPSRTSLLSGLRPDRTGVFDNDTAPRTNLSDHVFLPEHFKRNGYFTARVGKIYHEAPSLKGAQNDPRSWNVTEQGRANPKQTLVQRQIVHGRGTRLGLEWNIYEATDENTTEGAVARRIAQLMEERAKSNQPFFLAAGFRKPHLKWDAPKRYFDLYDPAQIPLPQEPPDHLHNVPRAAAPYLNQKGSPLKDDEWRQALRAYYACISFMDAQVGVLLDQMDRLKLWDNTVVVFFGDHGYNLGEHGGAWEKVKLWEESLNAPLIIAAPKAKGVGKASQRTVELLDIYPTLVEMCNLPSSSLRRLEGRSLLPLLQNPRAAWNKPAYSMVGTPALGGRSVRTEAWHYVKWTRGEGGEQLYDMQRDPREYRNLAGDPKYAKTIAEMRRLLEQERQVTTPKTMMLQR
ncbi:MAG: sulfatase, partial [Pyrinomonadaceae bacterium]|nr:sulfatase [Pyrinomonadaceae bacterium]